MPDLELRIKTPAELDGAKAAEEAVKNVTKATESHSKASAENAQAQTKNTEATEKGSNAQKVFTDSLKKLASEIPGVSLALNALKSPFIALAAVMAYGLKELAAWEERMRLATRAIGEANAAARLLAENVSAPVEAMKKQADAAKELADQLQRVRDNQSAMWRAIDEREDADMALSLAEVDNEEARGVITKEDAMRQRRDIRQAATGAKRARRFNQLTETIDIAGGEVTQNKDRVAAAEKELAAAREEQQQVNALSAKRDYAGEAGAAEAEIKQLEADRAEAQSKGAGQAGSVFDPVLGWITDGKIVGLEEKLGVLYARRKQAQIAGQKLASRKSAADRRVSSAESDYGSAQGALGASQGRLSAAQNEYQIFSTIGEQTYNRQKDTAEVAAGAEIINSGNAAARSVVTGPIPTTQAGAQRWVEALERLAATNRDLESVLDEIVAMQTLTKKKYDEVQAKLKSQRTFD